MTVARLPLLPLVLLAAGFAGSGASATASAASENHTAELDPVWRHWAYSRPITIGEEAIEQRLVRVPLSNEVFARANPGLTDLRVIDDSGNETGYVLSYGSPPLGPHSGGARGHWYQMEMVDTGYVPGEYTQAIADTGNDGRVHDLVKIELLNRRDEFFAWAEIASSPDYKTWRTLRAKAPVYHFRETREGQAMRVTYPPTRDRWLRLRLQREDEEVPIAFIRIGKRIKDETDLVDAGLELELREDSPGDESWWEARAAARPGPIFGVRIETAREEFHRPVKLSVSSDGDTWQEIGRGLVYRLLNRETDGAGQESLQVEFSGAKFRGERNFWRVAILDGSDAPIEDLRITLLRPVQSVVFRPEAGRTFTLLYGHPRAAWPDYELRDLLDSVQMDAAPLGALGAEEKNPGFVSSDPFSERHPILMWGALALAVLALAAMAVKSLR